jgi:predicted O-methyltransferase YrrM
MIHKARGKIVRAMTSIKQGALWQRLFRRLGSYIVKDSSNQLMSRALRLAGVPSANRIFSYTRPCELETLYRLAAACPPGGKALEIGSHLGASSCYLGAALKQLNGTLFCVDTWNNETMPEGSKDTFSEFSSNTLGLGDVIVPIRKRSSELTRDDVGADLDLVFIDGDHSYESVKSDFETVVPWLTEKAMVAFHDTVAFEGVARLLGEVLACSQARLAGHVNNLTWVQIVNQRVPLELAHEASYGRWS